MSIEKSFVILADERIDVVVSSATTGGKYSILTEVAPPQAGPPPHIHTMEDEFLMPLSGSFEIFDGTEWSPMPAQGYHTPRGTLHTWRNSGQEPAKLLIMATGDSFDVFIEKLVGLNIPRDLQRLVEISAEHGISYVLSPAPDEAQSLAMA
ncbi:cupin domain-containing protein [Terriglobus aquaticus]|uniref:Cupin domain-containing protein n=1 Tax=Terriglobus aquaticus TaxID=940139 RepID=A0ABW9KJ96_9BACT|nr:cupin domain-containing protein [Terriglobus aquaticus]